jgi:hypothetical protein
MKQRHTACKCGGGGQWSTTPPFGAIRNWSASHAGRLLRSKNHWCALHRRRYVGQSWSAAVAPHGKRNPVITPAANSLRRQNYWKPVCTPVVNILAFSSRRLALLNEVYRLSHFSANAGSVLQTATALPASFPINKHAERRGWQASPPTSFPACLGF